MWTTKPNNVEDAFSKHHCNFRVNFCIEKLLPQFDNEDKYIDPIEGKVYSSFDEGNKEDEIGTLKLYRFKISYLIGSQSLYDILDCTSAETESLFNFLFDKQTYDFKEHFRLQDVPINNILHFSRIELNEPYRGFGLGQEVINQAINIFSDWDYMLTVKPFPLQHENLEINTEKELSNQVKVDLQKIRAFWRSLGFEQIENSEFFMKCLA